MKKITIEKYISAAVIVAAFVASAFIALSAQAVTAGNSDISIAPGQSWKGTIPASSKLSLEGRIVYEKPAGANYVLELIVNGKPVISPLVNKGQSFKYQDGRTFAYRSGNNWILFYSADLSANNSTAGGGYRVMTDPGEAYRYSWDISSLLNGSSQMDVEIKNVSDKYTIVGRLTSVAATMFPIAELGNCGSTADCKAYCDNAANIVACTAFAEKNGMITSEEATQAREFADVLKGEGPGACKTKDACEAYCNGVAHMSECVAFASKHNLIPADQLEQAQKVAAALQAGAQLPGGCTDQASCNAYCADANHADSCLAFAEKAGFLSADELAKAKKVLPLIASGDSPGKCTTKDTCEAYCAVDSHAVECANFAEKAGFMTADEAALVRQTGGKGPGGCSSKDACDAYCNKPENQAACFQFAQDHNLIPADKLQEIKDGMGRLRSGISQMPGEAVNCLKDKLGNDIVGRIESGQFTPGPQTGDIIKGCVEQAMPQIKASINAAMNMATPAVTQCLETALGADGLAKIKAGEAPTPEMGDAMKKCFESMKTAGLEQLRAGLQQMPPELKQCLSDKLGADTISKIESGSTDVTIGPDAQGAIQGCVNSTKDAMMQKAQSQLQQAPPEIRDCIQKQIDAATAAGASGPGDIQSKIQECMKNFKPSGIPSGMENYKPGNIPEGSGGPPAGVPSNMENYVPPGVPTNTAPPAGTVPSAAVCASFAAAPSCDYVPESARDMCKQCKAE
jgi:hypothetical protein